MRELIDRIPPRYRRWVVVAGAVGVFSLVLTIAGGITGGGGGERTDPDDARSEFILTDRDSSGARVERLQAEFENMREDNEDLSEEINRLNRSLERREENEGEQELRDDLSDMRRTIEQMRSQDMEQGGGAAPGGEDGAPINIPDGDQSSGEGESGQGDPGTRFDPDAPAYQRQLDSMAQEDDPMWADAGPQGGGSLAEDSEASMGGGARSSEADDEDSEEESGSRIRSIAKETADASDDDDVTEGSSDEDSVYVPAGSIITGTLITGMDAPTGQQARQDPHPALLRIKREAILPNRFRADVRECFVLMGGRGSLSSERAYLRGETISCVREDGGVVEASMNSYTVGEDGKAGLRGRLVSKQGQFLARALMAGFLESFANAFDQTPVPSIDVNDGDDDSSEQIYQQALSNESLQSATVSGAGRAMDRLAEFYIDQAEGLFPVIEVDAGREVEIVLINGTDLQIR